MLIAGYQSWRRLLFVHWRVPSTALRPLVPSMFSIDEFDGAAWVTLLPFSVEAARPIGAPASLGLRFLETNVRTYVRLRRDEPAIYFFSLDAASLLAVIGARVAFGLPYFWAAGRERRHDHGVQYSIRRHGAGFETHVRYAVGASLGTARTGSLDEFLVERYVLHARRGPSIWSVRVHHQPYPLHQVALEHLSDALVGAAGFKALGQPDLVHFASGVDVGIEAPRVTTINGQSAITGLRGG